MSAKATTAIVIASYLFFVAMLPMIVPINDTLVLRPLIFTIFR